MEVKTLVIPRVDSAEQFFAERQQPCPASTAHRIGCVNWPDYPYRPEVFFAIAHTGNSICIRFTVDEKYTRALVTEDNKQVCNDSCVEFFISFDEAGYYNLETNAIGTSLLRFRKERDNAPFAGPEVMGSILRNPSLGKIPFPERTGRQQWALELEVPVSAFFRHDIRDLSGREARANFYKCGDELTEPHFLSWNPVNHPTPNFHLEAYFGKLYFE